MGVDTERHSVVVKVIDRVKVLKESITDEEQILVLTGESAFMDHEVTLLVA